MLERRRNLCRNVAGCCICLPPKIVHLVTAVLQSSSLFLIRNFYTKFSHICLEVCLRLCNIALPLLVFTYCRPVTLLWWLRLRGIGRLALGRGR